MKIILVSLFGYLLGSIPFALVIGKVFYNTDVREHGSGNLGGTNAGRTLGKKAGVSVAVLDVLKATLAMALVYPFAPEYVIYSGFFATIGHIFPIFAQFRGGKAVSTSFGFLLGISLFVSKQIGLHFFVPLIIFFISLYISKMVSLSAMIAITLASIILWFTCANSQIPIAFTIINLIVVIRHKDNIKRIKNKTESKIKWL